MRKENFDALVEDLALCAVSCDFDITDAQGAIWDGIRDNDYMWEGEPILVGEFNQAVYRAGQLMDELKSFYDSILWKYIS